MVWWLTKSLKTGIMPFEIPAHFYPLNQYWEQAHSKDVPLVFAIHDSLGPGSMVSLVASLARRSFQTFILRTGLGSQCRLHHLHTRDHVG